MSVEIKGRKPSPQEKERTSRRRLEKHRRLIESLGRPKPPELEAKITAGYEQMFQNLREEFLGPSNDREVSPDLDLTRFKEVVNGLFTESPAIRNESRGKLTPRQAQALIYRYGLSDGVQRNYTEVDKAMGNKRTGHTSHLITMTLLNLAFALEDQKLLTRSP